MLLSEVCRLWKNILFNAGILWSSLNRVACPPRFLDLAQGASLRIQLQRRGLDPDLSPFRRILVSNITRVQELHIINRIPHRFKLYLDHELPYAPQLEVLSLMGSAESPEFFEFTIPELRTLFLCRCPGLPTHPLPQLTHLYLSH
ncbi:hypothetical protein CERSUDRAFT_85394 [Gelatoporia subvermispora B]|uniref:F-box domain-containing protein n=1 Tax=Ceriporiopsis subvermispora (strain B) TaxID=914234 RepID=M2QTM3_CERS8|nr:hypothetical protein CERSUDRAFT_85394 [Gelatoporia subvermispora B]